MKKRFRKAKTKVIKISRGEIDEVIKERGLDKLGFDGYMLTRVAVSLALIKKVYPDIYEHVEIVDHGWYVSVSSVIGQINILKNALHYDGEFFRGLKTHLGA